MRKTELRWGTLLQILPIFIELNLYLYRAQQKKSQLSLQPLNKTFDPKEGHTLKKQQPQPIYILSLPFFMYGYIKKSHNKFLGQYVNIKIKRMPKHRQHELCVLITLALFHDLLNLPTGRPHLSQRHNAQLKISLSKSGSPKTNLIVIQIPTNKIFSQGKGDHKLLL